VLKALREHALLAPGGRAVVAVSGGADSTALLLVLDALSRRYRQDYALLVAHLDHGLRGAESAADAAFVAGLARTLAVPFVRGAADSAPGRRNLEAWARAERGRFLARVAREFGTRTICLGHTRDDQAETVLMRLARGGGPASLAAMQPRRADEVVRPLLGRTRAECAAYVRDSGWSPCHDRSNEDDRFFRNRVRRQVLPELSRQLGVDMVARLARLAEDVAVEARLADERIAALLPRDGADLPIALVRSAGLAAGRLVHAWLARSGVRPSHAQVEDVVRIARGERPSARVDLGGGLVAQRTYERLGLATPRSRREGACSATWPIPGHAALGEWQLRATIADPRAVSAGGVTAGATLLVDSAVLGPALAIRAPLPGDRIRLRGGSRKLSDVMVDRRVPRALRLRLAVVTVADGSILWVPGIAASSAVRSPSSGEVVVLSVEKGLPEVMQRGKNAEITGENCRAPV
jgi:tRNA(Ile)-lysidine synthetase-like protein